jgi:hypothetical protein
MNGRMLHNVGRYCFNFLRHPMATDQDIAQYKKLLAKHSPDQLIAKIHNLVATDAEHIAAVQLLRDKQDKTQLSTLVAAWLAVLVTVIGVVVQICTNTAQSGTTASLTSTALSTPTSNSPSPIAKPQLASQPPALSKP